MSHEIYNPLKSELPIWQMIGGGLIGSIIAKLARVDILTGGIIGVLVPLVMHQLRELA